MERSTTNQGRLRLVAQARTIRIRHDIIKSVWSEATLEAIAFFGSMEVGFVQKCYDNILRKRAKQSAAAETGLHPTRERKPTVTICRRETGKL